MYTNRDLEFEFRNHLDSGEILIWTGSPKQGLILTGSDVFLIPFSLLWGGFAIFWEYTAVTQGAPFFFTLFGLPFVVIGLYLIFGRFFYDSIRRKNTVYGLTNSRIIIKSGVFSKSQKSIDLTTLTNLTLNEKPDGSGTIILGPDNLLNGYFRNTGWSGMDSKMTPSIEMIQDVRQVYRKISEIQKSK